MPIDHFQAQRFGRLELLAKQAVEGFITGLHKSPYHGFSVEFAEHRAYNTGESTRHIDWKLYGRTDKMFVKRYEEETNLRCNIVIDRSGSMYYPQNPEEGHVNKIQFAIQSAASLIYLMRSQRDAVGLTLFGEGIELSTPSKSSSVHHAYLFNELEKIYDLNEGAKESNIVESLHIMAEKTHKRSLVVVFSDFMDTFFRTQEDQSKLFEALQHLRYNRHEVILFHLFDQRTEVELELENRPYTFIDLETNEKVKVMPHDIQRQYKELREQRINDVKLKCRQYGIDWNACDVEEGVVKVLDRFLAKRSRLG
ncbi:MAG: DUF58 domain-containing protein [Flavobacteriales bacterium]